MARKRTEHPAGTDERIDSLMRAGQTAKAIAATLRAEGVDISEATVGRRLLETRGHVRVAKSPPDRQRGKVASSDRPDVVGANLPSTPEDIPEGASLTQLDGWIEQAEEAINKAQLDSNLPLLGQMLRVAASLAETRRKATPPAKADPNDAPDMVALGKTVAERLHKMIDLVVAA